MFRLPVDSRAPSCETYYDVVTRPMDFEKIHDRFLQGKYTNLKHILNDFE